MKSGYRNAVRSFQRETCFTYRCISTFQQMTGKRNNRFPVKPYSLSLVHALLLIISSIGKSQQRCKNSTRTLQKGRGARTLRKPSKRLNKMEPRQVDRVVHGEDERITTTRLNARRQEQSYAKTEKPSGCFFVRLQRTETPVSFSREGSCSHCQNRSTQFYERICN